MPDIVIVSEAGTVTVVADTETVTISESTGTVHDVSIVSANGFAGTVTKSMTTPAITLSTTVTGMVKGNGTKISAATAGTDFVVPGGALGTPSSGTLTSCTGLPISTGVSGLGTSVAAFLATPNSANLKTAVTDETGTGGSLVFANTPILVTPILGIATATSVNKVTVTAPATGSTLTIVDGATLTASATANVSGTNTGDNAANSLHLPLAGGAMTGSITNIGTKHDTEMAGDFFGIQLSADHTQGTMVNFDGLDTYNGASHMKVLPTGLTFPDTTVQTTAYTGGGGTVTKTSVVSANGFTGTVATDTTTPAITLTTSITGLLKGDGTAISAATAGTDYVIPSGSITGNASTVTTNANLTGVINSTGNTTTINSQTGTGSKFVVDTSPVLVTPTIGVATATSVNKITVTAPATGATLTIVNGATLTASATASVSGTNTGDNAANTTYSSLVSNATHTGDATGSTALTVVKINGVLMSGLATGILKNTTTTGVPSIATAGTDYVIPSGNITGSAASLSATLAVSSGGTGVTTSTGSGANALATSPTLVTPILGVAAATTINKVAITAPATGATLTIVDGATLTASATASVSGTNTGDNATNTTYSSLVSNATHTGDATGATALTVVKINGVLMSGLATGILKNTTTTGVPSIATAGTDYVIPSGNITGTAAGLSTTLAVASGGTGVTTSTGSGANALATSPTLVTPILGVAAATTINKVAITAPATGATLTIVDGATLTASATASVSGTNTGDNAANTTYSSLVSNATHTGDATGSTALTVVKINGVLMSGLATGLLKNTTTTGVPTIATAGTDYVIPSGSITGSAASLSATLAVASGGTGVTTSSGTGAVLLGTSPAITTPTITGINEVKTAPTISAGVLNLNCALGNVFHVSLNAAITSITFSNIPASGTAYGLTLAFTADGTSRSVTWGSAIKWASGTAPTLTSTNAKVDIFVLTTWDAGTTWYSMVGGQNF